MYCQDWEERIALHAGGDLAAAEAAAVERHLAACAECRAFRSAMSESLELLREAHTEALEPAFYTAVRGRVMAELEGEASAGAGRRLWLRRGWMAGMAAGLVAAALLLALALSNRPVRRLEAPPRVAGGLVAGAGIPPAPRAPAPLPDGRGSGRSPARRPAWPLSHGRGSGRSRAHKQAASEPLLVRLVTDDPNVVIYWIAE